MNGKRDYELDRHTPDYRRPDGTVDPAWKAVPLRVRVACATAGCPLEGRASVVAAWSNADGIVRVQCGGCGEWHEHMTVEPRSDAMTALDGR